LPNSIKDIEEYAFNYCSSLSSIELPNNIKYIKTGTFTGCSKLTTITIPKNVIKIGDMAFHNCPNLITITCLAKEPPTLEIEVFPYPNDITLLVPKGCKDKYINSDWNKYFNGRIKEME
jgi:hypothetical protein